jgi:glycerol-3-phosphate dehydrogenase
VELTAKDVQSAYAGVRPLVRSRDAVDTKKLIRDHEVEVDKVSGLVSVLGGKWTTYRAMAEDGINHAQQALSGRQAKRLTAGYAATGSALSAGARCKTLDFPLTGARGFTLEYWKELVAKYRLSPKTARHLAQKFGADSPKVLELGEQEEQLRQPLIVGGAAIQAEVVYAIREEMAQSIEDILLRRIGLQLYSWKEAVQAAPVVGRLLAREFNWTDAQTDEAVCAYLASIQHLLHSAGIGDS